MSRIVLDQAVANQLTACKDVTVLFDPHGTILGTFDPTPIGIYEEGEIPDFDEAELDRREQRRAGIPSDVARRILESMQ
ncbi:MAG: hypothetical protein SFU86_09660 [Pirellulaceae bacterium]|nr:hypothetical protein [Pirellulaceae bacterium]